MTSAPTAPASEAMERTAAHLICYAIEETYGKKCPDFEPECLACMVWREWETVTAERDALRKEVGELKQVLEWHDSRDTGLSSESIAHHMVRGVCAGRYPSDPADLGRCLRLLEIFPQWKDRIGEMAQYGDVWRRLVERWDDISASMENEVGIHWEKARSAPLTYKLMKNVMREFEAGEGKETVIHASDCAVHREPAYPAGACNCGATAQKGKNCDVEINQDRTKGW